MVGPAALAASALLAREPSTLGSRLRQTSSVILVVALVAALLVAAGSYARTRADGTTSGADRGVLSAPRPSSQEADHG